MLPPLSLDNDSFENLIEEYRSRIAGIYPDWTNYNYSDPGMTFLELFAWLRENQQYYMEQLGPDHYREFFRLAGFSPKGRECARILAEAVPGSIRGELTIPAGSRFVSGGLSFETTGEEYVPDAVILRAEHLDEKGRTVFFVEAGQLAYQGDFSFSPFGTEPQAGASMQLTVSGQIPAGNDFRLTLQLGENGRNAAAYGISKNLTELKWEYLSAGGFVPLTVVSDETNGLLYAGRITFRMERGPAAPDGLKIRATLVSGSFDIAPVINGLSLSQIELSQIRTHRWPEGLVIADGSGFPDQVCEIPQKNFLMESLLVEVEDEQHPGRMIPWTRTDDFLFLGPEARQYLPDEAEGTIRFGNGWHGMPPEGKIMLRAVTETAGSAGNIKIGSVLNPESQKNLGARFSMTRLISPGRDPETREQTLLRIIREKDRVQRAVTLSDYEHLAMETPGLCIHSCHAWSEDSDPMTVHLAVRPGDGRRTMALTEQEKSIITKYFEDRRLIGTKLSLHSPSYIRVDISVEAVPSPQYRDAAVLLEDEIRSWFEERKAIYGKPLLYNDLFSRLDAAPCVRKLLVLSLNPVSAGITRDSNRDLVPPVNGVFLPGQIEIIINHYQTV